MKQWDYDKKQQSTRISGVLYRGDAKNKYSSPNQPFLSKFKSVYPKELAIVNAIPNEEEASQFMLKAIDFDPHARSTHPNVDSKEDLMKYVISPERHMAYNGLWNAMCYFGVVANTAMWLYL
jgi:hypothetical protein